MKLSILLWFACFLVHVPGYAQVFATIEAVSGYVTITSENGTRTIAEVGHKLMQGDSVVTQGESELHAQTQDGGLVALRPHTVFKVVQYNADSGSVGQATFSLLQGALRSITGWIGKKNPGAYRIVTPTATIGIRGTDHETTVLDRDTDRDRAGTYDFVNEGATFMRTEQGELPLGPGQHGFSPRDGSLKQQLLERAPEFFAERRLRLEERIKSRKEVLKEALVKRFQQFMEDRRPDGDGPQSRFEDATDSQREAARQALRRKLQQRKAQ